ncbi:Sybindin-like protein [Macleaya cordata]|uniref:Sybindin-like protein n=1 Tax=Macleaya cordata TaxID=56857 RepID=A0A200QY19_MACCD|nr:Sybindin-like protein [Macleaya cordata]
MDTNNSLRLASLWHSMHAISQQLSPVVGCSGIELLEADNFDLHCFQSLTGESSDEILVGTIGTSTMKKSRVFVTSATIISATVISAPPSDFYCNLKIQATI